MPLLITYQGRPVKRRRQVGNRLKLLFYAPVPGQPGEQLLITQDQWNRFGKIQFFPRSSMPNVRETFRP